MPQNSVALGAGCDLWWINNLWIKLIQIDNSISFTTKSQNVNYKQVWFFEIIIESSIIKTPSVIPRDGSKTVLVLIIDVYSNDIPSPTITCGLGKSIIFWKKMTRYIETKLIQAEWRIYASANLPSLVQIIACRLVGAKPLSEPMLEYG